MFATLSYTACMFLGALNYFCRHVIGRNLRFIERMRAELPVKTPFPGCASLHLVWHECYHYAITMQ